MNAYEAILEALIARGRSGEGAAISVSMFDAMADWMTTPLLQYEGGAPPKRIGLAHTSIAPYGVFKTRDGADILISIQSDREWRVLAEKVLGDKALAADPAFATNVERVKRRAQTDGRVAAVFGALEVEPLMRKLTDADIASTAQRNSRTIRICAASPSARPTARSPIRRRPRNGPARRGAMGRCPRLASTAKGSGRSLARSRRRADHAGAVAATPPVRRVCEEPISSTNGIVISVNSINSLKSFW
jgi:formyl-CoA transferase